MQTFADNPELLDSIVVILVAILAVCAPVVAYYASKWFQIDIDYRRLQFDVQDTENLKAGARTIVAVLADGKVTREEMLQIGRQYLRESFPDAMERQKPADDKLHGFILQAQKELKAHFL